MDVSRSRPQLPALGGLLDLDMVKRDPDSSMHRSSIPPLPASNPSPPLVLHSNLSPCEPNSRSTQSNIGAWKPAPPSSINSGTSEPRRVSEDDQDASRQPSRQVLPSISEALGVGSPAAYAPMTTQSSLPPAHSSMSASTTSPSSSLRPYLNESGTGASRPPAPPTPPTFGDGQYSQYRSDPVPAGSGAPPEHLRPTYAQSESSTSLHSQPNPSTSRPAQPVAYTAASDPVASQHDAATHSAGPGSQSAYGKTTYAPLFGNPTLPPSTSFAPAFPPATGHTSSPAAPAWHPEASPPYGSRPLEPRVHRESVKRQLEFYDFEMALNDISQSTGIIGDFCRRYGELMHQTQRTGPSPSSLPSIVEVDDMVKKSQAQFDALQKIREVVLTQQMTYKQQPVELSTQPAMQRHDSSQPQAPAESSVPEFEQAKLGSYPFAEKKPGKRFGRAPPPGRCHSCNRAETPEWRRGPDGARTLCNACGLHYAKLTRKNNHANKNAPITNSNLRPKETYPQ